MSGLPTPHTAPPTSHGSTSPSAASSPNVRKERGAIAAQACDTCRSRKQRCDEQRPRCGTCQKFKLDCNYREPVPTKKDKTLTEILDRLKNLDDRLLGLENKVNSLGHSIGAMGQNQQAAPVASPTYSPPFQTSNYAGAQVPPVVAPAFAASSLPYQFSGQLSDLHSQYIYVSSVHGMLSWPAIQRYFSSVQPKLPNIDLSDVEREGVAHMLGVVGPAGSIGWPAEHIPNDQNVELIASLTWEYVHNLSQAYFDSINMLNPILDRQSFMGDILPKVYGQGFQRSIESTITLFVLALGEVAMTSSNGNPIHIYNGRASGVKGGTRDCPPGMELFNEARSRIGFYLTDCSLENVQMFALASAYYGSCFYPMHFWRMTASASLACQAMIRGNPSELSSVRAELIRRAFWYCSIMETMVHLELGFPLMGLEELEHIVKAPQLLVSNDDVVSSEQDPFFLPQIALRRMIIDNDNKLKRRMTHVVLPGSPGINNAEDQLTLQELIEKLAGELDEWRGMLPPYIRWQEDFPAAFPDSNQDPYTASLSIHPTPENTPISPMIPVPNMTSPVMFTTDLDAPPASYSYALDVQVAMLRSKYYYAKHVLYRPFLYKVLHYPEATTRDDAMGVAKLLRLCLKWPMAMSPTCKHKRLVPCLFFFTQNFFGILVLLHLSSEVPILREIRNNFCGERFEVEAHETVELYLDWLRDLKEIDAGTAWHWEITKVLYGLKE